MISFLYNYGKGLGNYIYSMYNGNGKVAKTRQKI